MRTDSCGFQVVTQVFDGNAQGARDIWGMEGICNKKRGRRLGLMVRINWKKIKDVAGGASIVTLKVPHCRHHTGRN